MIHRNKKLIICQVNFDMKRILLAVFILADFSLVHAQDLTGVWRGHFSQGTLHRDNSLRSDNPMQELLLGDSRYKFEVQIAQTSKLLDAITYSYLTTIFYGKAKADGTVNPQTKKVVLRELKLIEVRSFGGGACAMTCFMQYSNIGGAEFLEGTYTAMSVKDSSNCGKGTVFLRKVPSSDFYTEPFVEKREKEIAKNKNNPKPPVPLAHPDTVKVNSIHSLPKKEQNHPADKGPGTKTGATSAPDQKLASRVPKPSAPKKPDQHNPQKNDIAKESISALKIDTEKIDRRIIAPAIIPKVLSSRQNQLVRTITVNTNEIELDIYDDGTIDNDTVSVYLDKKLVISHAMLTDRAIIMKVHLDDDDNYHEVVMVADNEGTIPPNTSLMIVKSGDKRYEVRIVSTEQKNATVIFKYEKPK
jgi:hypothetical protein